MPMTEQYPTGWTEQSAPPPRLAGEVVARAALFVGDPAQLCALQAETRRLCRSVGFDEPAVFDSVIAFTELAHSLFIAPSRCGLADLSVVRRGGRLGLEVRAECFGVRRGSPVRVSVAFPLPAATLPS